MQLLIIIIRVTIKNKLALIRNNFGFKNDINKVLRKETTFRVPKFWTEVVVTSFIS